MTVHIKTPHGSRDGKMKAVTDWLKVSLIAGGSAGNHTVTGIAVGDEIVSVIHNTVGTLADVTSEFSVTAANTINNTGGTDTSTNQLLVIWANLT